MLKCFEESGSEVDAEIEKMLKEGRYKSINSKSLIPSVVQNNSTNRSSTSTMGTNETVGGVHREYDMDGRKFTDDEGQLELPFVFPISNDSNDFISTLCEHCLKSETQVRMEFGISM